MDDKKLDDLVRAEVVSREEFERANSDSGGGFVEHTNEIGLNGVVNHYKFKSIYFGRFGILFAISAVFESVVRNVALEGDFSILSHPFVFSGVSILTFYAQNLIPSPITQIGHFSLMKKYCLYDISSFISGAFAGALFVDYLK